MLTSKHDPSPVTLVDRRPASVRRMLHPRAIGYVTPSGRMQRGGVQSGARRAYLIGPDVLAHGEVLVRDHASGEQTREPIPD